MLEVGLKTRSKSLVVLVVEAQPDKTDIKHSAIINNTIIPLRNNDFALFRRILNRFRLRSDLNQR